MKLVDLQANTAPRKIIRGAKGVSRRTIRDTKGVSRRFIRDANTALCRRWRVC